MFNEKITRIIAATGPESGLHVFTSTDRKSSYFYFADADGSVVLLSRPYSRSSSAERAQQSLTEKTATFQLQKQGEKFQFQILTGNNKPLAQSRLFEKEAEAKAAIHSIEAALEAPTKTAESKKEVERAPETEIPVTETTNPPFRHSFRLDFYPDDGQSTFRGKIEHLLSRESKTFHGLDTASIETFVRKFLEPLPKTKTTPIRQKGVEDKTVQMELWQADQPTRNFTFPVGSVLSVAVRLKPKVKNAVEAKIFLKSMETNGQIRQLIGRQMLEDSAGTQRVPVLTQSMTPGFYQLIARINEPVSDRDQSTPVYESKQIIHLY